MRIIGNNVFEVSFTFKVTVLAIISLLAATYYYVCVTNKVVFIQNTQHNAAIQHCMVLEAFVLATIYVAQWFSQIVILGKNYFTESSLFSHHKVPLSEIRGYYITTGFVAATIPVRTYYVVDNKNRCIFAIADLWRWLERFEDQSQLIFLIESFVEITDRPFGILKMRVTGLCVFSMLLLVSIPIQIPLLDRAL